MGFGFSGKMSVTIRPNAPMRNKIVSQFSRLYPLQLPGRGEKLTELAISRARPSMYQR